MKEKVNPNGLLIVSPLGPKSPKRKFKKKRKTEFPLLGIKVEL